VTERAGYRRAAGSPRGEARRQKLLDRVVEDLAAPSSAGIIEASVTLGLPSS
jgi:hypothetical protein